jgi:predicted nucleotide-binding protein (sugar kinase/HSP70/actin superfamily)
MAKIIKDTNGRVIFTKEMKKTYKILGPQMLPIHFKFLQECFRHDGYDLEILTTNHPGIIEEGLKNVHNDTCYPALLVIGQMIDALKSNKYDLHKVALLITQTGGGCRASNYIHLLRKALIKAGLDYIPVISLSVGTMEKNPGFKLKLHTIKKLNAAIIYGDLLMWASNHKQAHEQIQGSSINLKNKWIDSLSNKFLTQKNIKPEELKKDLKQIVKDFDNIKETNINKVKVGIVGEIYVKFAPLGNNELEKFLIRENCQVVLPGLYDFLIFKIDNRIEDINLYGGSKIKRFGYNFMFKVLTKWQNALIKVLAESTSLPVFSNYDHLKQSIKPYVGIGNKMGEGWLLIAEMLELLHLDVANIVCTQPFGCLPNHIIGKGMIKAIRANHPEANIVPIDYDPGASKVNQENRIKLMLSNANSSLKK